MMMMMDGQWRECKEMEMEMEMLMGDGDDGQTVFGGIGKRKRSGHRAHRTQESHSRLALHLLDEMIGWRNGRGTTGESGGQTNPRTGSSPAEQIAEVRVSLQQIRQQEPIII